MGDYGKTIRDIRVGKGIKQNELYQNIMSKSYAINFEQGKHDISFSLLEQILDRLGVSLDEFRYISRGYNMNEIDLFFLSFAEYANSNNMKKLEELLNTCLVYDDQTSRIKAALVKSRIDQMNQFNETGSLVKAQISSKDQEIIVNYLSSVQTWTFFEIILYTNTTEYMLSEEKNIYYGLVFQFSKKYKNFSSAHGSLCTLYINLIYDLLTESSIRQYKSIIEELMLELKRLSKNPDCGFYRIIYNYYDGIISMIDTGYDRSYYEKAEQKSRFSVRMLREIDQEFIAQVFETILNDLLDSGNLNSSN